MSRVARKCFFGVNAPDSRACVHVDTETNTSLLILDSESNFSISAGKFSISVAILSKTSGQISKELGTNGP